MINDILQKDTIKADLGFGVDYYKGEPGKNGEDGKTPIKGVDYFTQAEIQQIEDNAAAKVDLSDYAKSADLSTVATSGSYNDLKDKPSIPSTTGLASTEYVDSKVGEIVIPTVPTKVSAFENDKGYLTEHQSLAEYAKKTEIPAPYTLPTASTSTLGGVKVDGNTITIADGVISSVGGVEPDAYIKDASVSGNTLTLTKKDDTEVVFTPSGGSGGGGKEYTFTNGLTETDGTVSWDLNKVVLKSSNNKGVSIGYFDIPDVCKNRNTGNGSVILGTDINWEDNGNGLIASGNGSLCGGYASSYSYPSSFSGVKSSGNCSIAYGNGFTNGCVEASGNGSVAIGYHQNSSDGSTYSKGQNSIAIGNYNTSANKLLSLAIGKGVLSSSNYQHCICKYNIEDGNSVYAHIVGNGTSNTSRSNAYTLDWQGNGTFAGTVSSSTGADYAEYFEWKDGNPNNEDRVGYIVALDGNKIVKANTGDDVLGICSGTAMVLGDSAEWNWNKRYLTDDFGRIIYEDYDVEHEEVKNDEGEVIEEAWTEHIHAPKENPDYDATKAYVKRADRPEWQIVGMMGKLYVRDDGSCIVNGYADVKDGIATKASGKTNMRVMERVTDNIVRVLMK